MPIDVLRAEAFAATPHRTLTLDSADALMAVVTRAREEQAKVLVLTGGPDAWCVGGDIAAFDGAADRAAYIDELATRLHAVVTALQELDAVVVAVVDGVAAGAGMPLAAAADIVLASDRARFTLGYTKLGLTPDGGTTMLSSSLGLHRALYAALVNPVITAAVAHQQGLVAEVLSPDDLLPRAEELAAQLAAGSREAMAQTKRVLRQQALPDARADLDREQEALVRAAGGSAAAEGIRADLEKRSALFPD
jgi:2-(1,2-epoxy-1,2-dihydrophenyl)acetyl-CoA isomerase